MCRQDHSVEARGAGRARNLRRLRDHAVQLPLDLWQVRVRRLPRLLQGALLQSIRH